jgi:MEMO1 family protein
MIREPAVAGHFYSANPQKLGEYLRSFSAPAAGMLAAKGVLAPHAGYIYSGAIAGATYAAVQLPRRFVILGPNHTGRGAALALHPAGEWRTPLGPAAVDENLNLNILAECKGVALDSAAHLREHSIEVQIPFLQAARGQDLSFAAICVGTGDYGALESLGHGLARVIRAMPDPVLLVVSSDLNHFETAEIAAQKDSSAIDKMLKLDPKGLYRTIHEKRVSMCGFAPTVALLTACLDLGATAGRLIQYANSGDVSGDYAQVVGYAGIAIV